MKPFIARRWKLTATCCDMTAVTGWRRVCCWWRMWRFVHVVVVVSQTGGVIVTLSHCHIVTLSHYQIFPPQLCCVLISLVMCMHPVQPNLYLHHRLWSRARGPFNIPGCSHLHFHLRHLAACWRQREFARGRLLTVALTTDSLVRQVFWQGAGLSPLVHTAAAGFGMPDTLQQHRWGYKMCVHLSYSRRCMYTFPIPWNTWSISLFYLATSHFAWNIRCWDEILFAWGMYCKYRYRYYWNSFHN